MKMKRSILFVALIVIAALVFHKVNNEELVYLDQEESVDKRVEDLLKRMTIEEKVGQMIQGERNSLTPFSVKKYNLGSILSGGGSSPKINDAENWRKMYNEYQESALNTRLKIPILYGIDAVHGHNNVYGATIFPHNIGLGATRDKELLNRIGKVTAKEISITGLNWNFSPCVAVVKDIRWGRSYESFGENPKLQQLLTKEYVKGLQSYNIVATAKHYVGDGGTKWGTGFNDYDIDQGDTRITEEELREIHLPGFLEAIEGDVKTIMVSFSSFYGKKMHSHSYLINDVLKKELGFEGFVISDWEGVEQIPAPTLYHQVAISVNAGVDMLMEPNNWKSVIDNLLLAVKNGDISQERIDDAVSRILKVKFETNLFENPYANDNSDEIGTDEHREIAREAVRKSLVLLKNENDILPLKKESNILLLGSGANNIGIQSGGWTIDWQGKFDNNNNKITSGTTILEAFKDELSASGGKVITDEKEYNKADVVVVVIGEKPYAEGKGDNGELTLDSKTALNDNLEVIKKAKETGLPTVVIMVGGRPMIISEHIDDWDGFIMAWLPGSEGNGITDVLFGDYDFEGKLPVSWPRTKEQLNNLEDKSTDYLYPYGFGLKMNL